MCLAKADEIHHEDAVAEDMTLSEWLERLNLGKYYYKFRLMNFQTIYDLRYASDEKFLIEIFKMDKS